MDEKTPIDFKLLQRSVLILAIIVSAAALYFIRSFIYPIFLAVLLSYLVYPLVKLLEKYLRHRGVATFLGVVLSLLVALGFFVFLSSQFSIFADEFPEFSDQAVDNLSRFQQYISENSVITFSSDEWLQDRITLFISEQENFLTQIFNATTGTLVALGVQPVYIFFMLYYRHHFRQFLFQVVNEKDHGVLVKILQEITSVTKNYVTGIFIVVLILCVLNSLGLYIIGVRYALFLGIISALFNFIPYFGTLIGGAVPLLYTLVSPEPSHAVGVIILFLIIQVLENNVLTPNITGGRVAISPLFTIWAIILGGFAWGIPGTLLSVPFLGIFKVVCQNVKSLAPIAFLLSSKQSQEAKPT